MKPLRKTLLVLGSLCALALVALVVLPVLLKDRIIERVKAELNERVAAHVDWADVGLTFLRDFPNLTFRLDALTVAGTDRFAGDTLAAIGSFRVVLDLGSVVRSIRNNDQIVVRSIELRDPVLHLKVLDDGTANWRIMKPAASAPRDDARAFNVGLRRLEVSDARVVLDNDAVGLFASLHGMNHVLEGDFTKDLVAVQTHTRADTATLRFAGVPYLNGVMLDIAADLEADLANRTFSFRNNEVRVNDLLLGFTGTVARAVEHVALDLQFNGRSADIKQLLSLIPALYTRDFATLQTSGTLAVAGHVKGNYGAHEFPAFALHATVDDGTFRYPDLPLPARNIFVDLAVSNPGADIDSTVVNLKRLHIELGNDPIDVALSVRTPVSDPAIDVQLRGSVDLGDARRTLKLAGVDELSGVVTADVSVQTRLSSIDQRAYDRVAARGTASLNNVTVRTAQLPHAIAVDRMLLQLTPQYAEVSVLEGRIGSSDIAVKGRADNLLGFALRDEDLRGSATFNSSSFNLDEWKSGDKERQIIPVPDGIDVTLSAAIARLTYDRLELSNARGSVRVKDERVTLEDFSFGTLGGEIGMSGYYETSDVARPTFDVGLAIKNLDIPRAFAGFVTMQKLAPVAQYARGNFSADLKLNGALGGDMMPLFDVLTGVGTVLTSRVELHDFPALDRLADELKIQQLKNPTLEEIRSSVAIHDGRLHVAPFAVKLGDAIMRVSGSNGIDRSLLYRIGLQLPRSWLGTEANRVVGRMVAQTGRVGLNVDAADAVELAVQLTGTVTEPALKLDFGGVVTAAGAAGQAVAQELQRRVEATEQRVDSAKAAMRRQAEAEAERLIRDAEQRAAVIRAEARTLADTARAEGYRRADELVARATSPLARAAAQPAADRLRKEADSRAEQIVREADRRADEMVAEARRKAAQLTGG